MQILFDARTAIDHFPGIGRYTVSLARAILPLMREDERLVLLRDPARPSQWTLTALEGERVQVVDEVVGPFSLRQQWVMPRLLRHLEADVYHSSYYLMPYLPGVPTVLTIYDLIPMLFPEYSTARARLLFRLTTSLALRAASHVILISQATRRDLLAAYRFSPEKLTVIPLAADPAFRPASPHEVESVRRKHDLPEDYVLYLGSNKPHKNLVRLIDAFSRIARHTPRIALVIAGAWDPCYPQARRRVAALELERSVHFLGPVAEEDLRALYSGATAFVFPSLYEGFGLPVLEAMACGTPIACSDASSLPEVAGDAALYFDPTDVEAIAWAFSEILTDPALRENLRAQGLNRASEFSWEQTGQETLDLYREIRI
jgi:glycosyltransferase involved in cell wall biosynthesis